MGFDALGRLRAWVRGFRAQVILRIAALVTTLTVIAFLVGTGRYYAVLLICSAAAILQVVFLVRFVERTNREVAQFIAAVRHNDFVQETENSVLGRSFSELHGAMADAMASLRQSRAVQEEERATLKVLIDHAPVALVAVDTDGSVELVNAAARRFLGRTRIDQVAALSVYGDDFQSAMQDLEAGRSRVVPMRSGQTTQRVKISVTELALRSRRRRLMAIENIQSELDATELGAWHNLVRVLTHEMMNSLTPVSSLAGTACQMVSDLYRKLETGSDLQRETQDVRDALDTIARRSEGLLHFVEHYRQLTRIPVPTKAPIEVAEMFERLVNLMAAEADRRGIDIVARTEPPSLVLNADGELVEQAMINLLHNALDALEKENGGRIEVNARLEPSGKIAIEVADNGPGIAPDILDKIFVPFFTTKKSGSGIGLSLVRQVMSAHEGRVEAEAREPGVAFTLRFP